MLLELLRNIGHPPGLARLILRLVFRAGQATGLLTQSLGVAFIPLRALLLLAHPAQTLLERFIRITLPLLGHLTRLAFTIFLTLFLGLLLGLFLTPLLALLLARFLTLLLLLTLFSCFGLALLLLSRGLIHALLRLVLALLRLAPLTRLTLLGRILTRLALFLIRLILRLALRLVLRLWALLPGLRLAPLRLVAFLRLALPLLVLLVGPR